MKKVIASVLCILLLTTACSPAAHGSSSTSQPTSTSSAEEIAKIARETYAEVLGDRDPSEFTDKDSLKVMAEIAKSGIPVSGYGGESLNTQPVLDFIELVEGKGDGEITVCTNVWGGSVTISRFISKGGLVTKFDQYATLSEPPTETTAETMEVFELRDDYLIYSSSKAEMKEGSGTWGFRVKPLTPELVEYNELYIDDLWLKPMMLRCEWSPEDMSEVQWNLAFEAIWCMQNPGADYGSSYKSEPNGRDFAVPAEEAEKILTEAFPVTVEELRKTEEYRASDNSYIFEQFMGGGYSPNYEVTACTKNSDGSLELTVAAVGVEFGQGATPYCTLTVMPNQGGQAKYVSNKPIKPAE